MSRTGLSTNGNANPSASILHAQSKVTLYKEQRKVGRVEQQDGSHKCTTFTLKTEKPKVKLKVTAGMRMRMDGV